MAILALPRLGKPTGKMPVVLMGKMPMPRFSAAANIAASTKPANPNNPGAPGRDAWNRLASVYCDDGDTAGTKDANDTQRATYRYDPASPQGLGRAGGLNRRVRKIVVGDDGNSTTQHIYHNTIE